LVAPILIFITGIIAPIGLWMPGEALAYTRVLGFAQHGVGKLFLLAVISLFLFHAVHRIYHGLHDIGVHAGTGAMVAAYGSAALGTVIAAWLLLAIGF